MAALKNTYEVLWQPYWSTMSVPGAAAPVAAGTVFTLFVNPSGAPGENTLRTNMELQGQLPRGYKLEVMYISVDRVYTNAPVPGTDTDDWVNFASQMLLEFNVISKTVFRAPLINIPSGSGITGFGGSGAAAVETYVNNGVADPRAKYSLKPQKITLEQQQNFDVTITAIRATPNITTGFDVRVNLEGVFYRPAQ